MRRHSKFLIAGAFIALAFPFFLFAFFSKDSQTARAVRHLSCKQVCFPEELVCYKECGDSVVTLKRLCENSYKVLLYVDSKECLSCSVHLARWAVLMREAKARYGDALPFIFVFQANDQQRLFEYLREQHFTHDIYFDSIKSMESANPFLKKYGIHAFLLDANNKIVCVGNPVHENRVWELYKQCIENSISCTAPEPEN